MTHLHASRSVKLAIQMKCILSIRCPTDRSTVSTGCLTFNLEPSFVSGALCGIRCHGQVDDESHADRHRYVLQNNEEDVNVHPAMSVRDGNFGDLCTLYVCVADA